MAAKQIDGNFPYDGLVGLAPNIPENGPSYVEALKKNGIIDKTEFSMFLSVDAATSYIEFGGYDADKLLNNTNMDGLGLHWYDLTGSRLHWQVKMVDLTVGNSSVFSSSAEKAVFDSSSPYIIVPQDVFKDLIAKMKAESNVSDLICTDTDMDPGCMLPGRCSKNLKRIAPIRF